MTAPGVGRAATLAATAALAALVLYRLAALLAASTWCPWGLDYGEGIVWQQMVEIAAGRGYAPVAGYPAIVFHYPPGYHLTAAAVAALGLDGLLAGRLVSSLATLGCAALIGWLALAGSTRRAALLPSLVGGLVGAAAFGSMFVVRYWGPMMRVDPLACLFELGGIAGAIGALRRPALIYPAALLFVAAFFTKQTEVAGPIAAIGVLLLARPATARRGAATGIVAGGAVLAALEWTTGGSFLRHIFAYNMNRFDAATLLGKLRASLFEADRVAILLACVTATTIAVAVARRLAAGRRAFAADRWAVTNAILLAFLCLKTLSIAALGKSGGAGNYLYEWEGAAAVYVGIATIEAFGVAARWQAGGQAGQARLVSLLGVGLAGLLALLPRTYELPYLPERAAVSIRLARLLAPVRGDVLSDDMVLLFRIGRPVTWEPAIFQELAATGHYDETAVIDAVRTGRIGAVVTEFALNDPVRSRYTPAMGRAIAAALPVQRQVDGWSVYLPAATR